MSLDVSLLQSEEEVYDANITHNLAVMAGKAGIYYAVWCPDQFGFKTASQLILPLRLGIARMQNEPNYYRKFNASNGWGTYDQFVPWLERYLKACIENPDAEINVSR